MTSIRNRSHGCTRAVPEQVGLAHSLPGTGDYPAAQGPFLATTHVPYLGRHVIMTMPWQQEVTCLPLAPGVRAQLLNNGFRTVADVQATTLGQLSSLAGISPEDAQEVLHAAWACHTDAVALPAAVSALEVFRRTPKKIILFCEELDRLLDGGVHCGRVTEFCGGPGVGKTQLGMQLAVDVQLPKAFQGAGGAAVYIDTEGSFMVERVAEIAAAASRHVEKTARMQTSRQPAGPDAESINLQAQRFTMDAVLSNIHVFRAHDTAQQLACVHLLPSFLTQHPEVRLVVMDSVTFHFRQDMKDFSARARVLTGMAQALMQIAEQYHVAVVLMNQVTTRVFSEAVAQLVPALGESWGHAASTRVLLTWQGPDRCAYVYKSSYIPPGSAKYLVTPEGVRGPRKGSKRSGGA